MRVFYIDANRYGCPGNLKFVSAAGGHVKVCSLKSGPGCSSMKSWTQNVSFSQVRGYAYGHQVRTLNLLICMCWLYRGYLDNVSK